MPALRIQLNSLPGLRFFAALAVILYHLRIYFAPMGDSLAVFGYGFTGVSFFFILSGFVLTWSQSGEVTSGRFYWNRFARIWPLHVLTMIASIWVPTLSLAPAAGWAAVPFVLTLTQAWIPASPFLTSFNGVSWSLSCEAFFYLLFPLLFRNLTRQVKLARTAGLVLSGLLLAGISLSAYISIPGFLVLIAAAVSRDLSGNGGILASKPLVRLGQWSFALYLVHELVIRLGKPIVADMQLQGAYGVAVLIISLSVALSGLFHEFVEKPAERWLRSRLTRRPASMKVT